MNAGRAMPVYHLDAHSVMRCQECGHQQWRIGRLMAECSFCDNAIPLAEIASQPMEPRFTVTCSKTAEMARGVQ